MPVRKFIKYLINLISLLQNLVKLLKSTYTEFNHINNKDAGEPSLLLGFALPPISQILIKFSENLLIQKPHLFQDGVSVAIEKIFCN